MPKPCRSRTLSARADVVILAIYFDAIKQLIATYRGALAAKIIVDPSNPIAPDGKGGFNKTIPAEQSSGQLIFALLPSGAQLVKAFGTLSAQSLASGANRSPERAVLFYATDYPDKAHKAGHDVSEMLESER
jgi:8-hydroxy-5-deazaflavin:NADPH oxidoreductase